MLLQNIQNRVVPRGRILDNVNKQKGIFYETKTIHFYVPAPEGQNNFKKINN